MLHHAGLDTTDTCGQAHIDTPLFNNQSTTSHLEQPVWGGHCHYWLNSWLCVSQGVAVGITFWPFTVACLWCHCRC